MISQTAEYALRAMVFLANHNGPPTTTAEIARHTRVPPGYLAKILQSLGRSELVRSQRGLQGGFTLAAAPGDITLLQVIGAVDPIRRITACPLGLPSHEKLCPLHDRLDCAIAQFEEAFRHTTIGELVDPSALQSKTCRFPGIITSKPGSKTAVTRQ